MNIWFDKGVDHRKTGKSGAGQKWGRKPLRLKIAIILAANRHHVDIWELLRPDPQENYLREADRLISESVTVAVKPGLERDRGVTA